MTTYNFDETNPADTSAIPAFPANERSHRAAVKGAFTTEHTVKGRHAFANGDSTARDAIADWGDGALWLLEVGSSFRLQVYDGSVPGWVDLLSAAQYADRTAIAEWTAYQYANVTTITPAAGTPNTIAIDSAGGPNRKVTLTAASQLSSPVGFTAGICTDIQLEVYQDATGGRTLSFGPNYVFAGATAPAISTVANALSVLRLSRLSNNKWLVTMAAGVA